MRSKIDYTVTLNYLPQELLSAIKNLNINFLTEIRLRKGQPVIIEYKGEYKYINGYGVCSDAKSAIVCVDPQNVLLTAMGKCVYAYSNQLKQSFITVDGGVRIGVAGEYVTENGFTVTVKNVTSLNIRIPHDVYGIADRLYRDLFSDGLKSTLIFSPAGFGKTTLLRDVARVVSDKTFFNVLIIDERNEIAAVDERGVSYDIGGNCDVIRGSDKLTAFSNAVRALSPQVIITDELYGAADFGAAGYASDCGIAIIATSHTTDKEVLKTLPFERYVELTGVGKDIILYDKNFNIIDNYRAVGRVRNSNFS